MKHRRRLLAQAALAVEEKHGLSLQVAGECLLGLDEATDYVRRHLSFPVLDLEHEIGTVVALADRVKVDLDARVLVEVEVSLPDRGKTVERLCLSEWLGDEVGQVGSGERRHQQEVADSVLRDPAFLPGDLAPG